MTQIFCMKRVLFFTFILFAEFSVAQADTSRWLRAFPLTDYIVELNDSTQLVQIKVPAGSFIKEKQLGLIRGVYNVAQMDTVQKGYGRCHLIKGEYFYFSITHNNSGVAIKKGDLLYTFVKPSTVYNGQMLKLASHFITLQNVQENTLYDPINMYNHWEKIDETNLIDSLVADIKFTGNYFQKNNPSIDLLAKDGQFKGKKTFAVMIACEPAHVIDFLDYVIARPRLYAGKEWKIAEIFATWVAEGAPTVIRE